MDGLESGGHEHSWLRQIFPNGESERLDSLALCLDRDESATTGVVVLGDAGATSLKVTNLILNWRKVIELANESALETAGAASVSWWLVPLAALHLVQKAQRRATVHVSREDALVLVALWKIRRDDGVPEEIAWKVVQASLREDSPSEFTYKQFNVSLDNLIELKAIDIIAGRIYSRERVKLT